MHACFYIHSLIQAINKWKYLVQSVEEEKNQVIYCWGGQGD